MRKIFFLFCFLIITIPVFADQQIVYSIESNNNLGILQRLNSYNSFNLNNWLIENTSFIKISERQDIPKEYYLRNYLRNKVSVSYFGKNFKSVAFIGGEFYFRDNTPNHISGWSGTFSKQNTYYGGSEFSFNNKFFNLFFDLNYMSQQFEREENTEEFSENEEVADTDFSLSAKLSLKNLILGNPFLQISHYDDLNDADIFNVTTLCVGDEYTKKIAFKYFINQKIAAGYSDVNTEIPYFGKYNLRVTGKFSQKWMLVGRLQTKFWIDEKFAEFYAGNNFAETIIQRNISYSPENFVNKFQFGFRYNFTEALIVKSALQYGISRFLFNADYRYYFADKVYDKMKFAGKFSYVFPKSKNRISYIFRYKQLDTDNSEISSAFSVEIVL